jgi:hypothetical protein
LSASPSCSSSLILLGLFGLVVVLVGLAIAGVEHSMSLSRVLQRLQDTTAQIRVRAAFVLLIGSTAPADQVGLETVLGAFAAGALLGRRRRFCDRHDLPFRRAENGNLPARVGEHPGVLTLISDGDVLTGAYGLGPEAGEWMQQATIAFRAHVSLAVLADTIQPFPTFSESFHFALAELTSQVPAGTR